MLDDVPGGRERVSLKTEKKEHKQTKCREI